MTFIELAGYGAMIVMAVSLTPQVIKSWKTKSTKDISILWNSLYLFGLILWVIYGLGISSVPLVGAAIIEAVLAGSLIILKIKYG
ncbi:SemiSWEET family sugar transporter [Nanoarchaeota archaeon]